MPPRPAATRPAPTTDLGHALRALSRTPGWTLASIATLALVAGTSTAFFSLAYGAFFRSVEAQTPERLVLIATPTASRDRHEISPAMLDGLRARSAFTAVGGAKADAALIAQDQPERLESVRLTPEWLPTVKPALALGAGFVAADHEANAPLVALISHRLWQQRFGGRGDVLGQSLSLQDGRQVQVRGVMARGFEAPLANGRPPQLWLPLRAGERDHIYECPACPAFLAVARLRDGVDLEDARREASAVLEVVKGDCCSGDRSARAIVAPFTAANMNRGSQQDALRTMFGAALFLLAVGAASIGLQLLGRTLRRRREHAIHQAIGAWRGRLIGQILLEGGLLAGAGALLGTVVAAGWLVVVKLGYVSAFQLNPGFRAAGLDAPTLGFAAGQAFVIAGLITLPATLLLGRTDVHGLLKESSRSHTGSRGSVLTREALLAVQIALTVVLQMQGNVAALAVLDTGERAGFMPIGVRQMQIEFPEGRLWGAQNQFKQKVLDRISSVPEVRAAALIAPAPLAAFEQTTDTATVHEGIEARATPVIRRAVGGDLLGTLGMRLVAGRVLAPDDHRHPARPVVVDQRFVNALFPGQDALGKKVTLEQHSGIDDVADDLPFLIVGVVNDVLTAPSPQRPLPNIYTPYQLSRSQVVHFLAASHGDHAAVDAGLRAAVRAAEPGQPVAALTSYLRLILEHMVALLGTTFAIGIFGSIAWVLAVAGLRSTTTGLIEARTNEIGLRLAIGSTRAGIVTWALRQSARAIAAGTLLGTGLLIVSSHPRAPLRLLGDFPLNWPWLAISAGAVAVPVALAVMLPAWRASARPPMAALRHE